MDIPVQPKEPLGESTFDSTRRRRRQNYRTGKKNLDRSKRSRQGMLPMYAKHAEVLGNTAVGNAIPHTDLAYQRASGALIPALAVAPI